MIRSFKIRRGETGPEDGATTTTVSLKVGAMFSASNIASDPSRSQFFSDFLSSATYLYQVVFAIGLPRRTEPVPEELAPFEAESDSKHASAPLLLHHFPAFKMLSSQSAASMDQLWLAAARQCSLHTSNCSLHQTHQRRKGSGKLLQSKTRASHSENNAGEKVFFIATMESLYVLCCPRMRRFCDTMRVSCQCGIDNDEQNFIYVVCEL